MSHKPAEEFYFIQIGAMWRFFTREHFSFWMICCYLFFEYSRPQAIFPQIDFLPWAQLFLVLSLAGAFLDKSVSWVSSPVNIIYSFFALLIYISSKIAYFPDWSTKYFIDFYGWFVVYFLIINIVNTRRRFYIFLIVFLFSAAKISIGTSLQWVARGFAFTDWGLQGPSGYFENSGELAILMLTLFPVAFYLFTLLKNRIKFYEKLLLLAFWVTPILTIMGASSRGSQLALAALLLAMFRKHVFKIRPLIGIVAMCFLLIAILPDEQKNRFSNAGEDKTSTQRLLYWKRGWEIMKDHPVLGIGYFNFPPYFERYYAHDMLYPQPELPHNILIQVGTDVGFLGLSVFVLFFLMVFIIARRMHKKAESDPLLSKISVGVAYGVLGFFLAGQFVTVTYYPFLWISLSFLVAANNISKTREECNEQPNKR